VLKAEQQDEHGKGLNSHGFKMLGIDSEARRALRQPRPRKRATRPKGGISPKNGEMPP